MSSNASRATRPSKDVAQNKFQAANDSAFAYADDPNDIYKNRTSFEFSLRVRRFAHIRKLIEAALAEKEKVEILDIGGSQKYWLIGEEFINKHKDRLHFTILNVEDPEHEAEEYKDSSLFSFIIGSGCDPDLLKGRTFDIVHSNSVIEHVGDWSAVTQFADNVRRLGKRYYMQTPDFWFPYEPHFRFVGFQYLPVSVRATLLNHMKLGFFEREENKDKAHALVEDVRLLKKSEVADLFPEARIEHEKIFGLSKSLMAIRS